MEDNKESLVLKEDLMRIKNKLKELEDYYGDITATIPSAILFDNDIPLRDNLKENHGKTQTVLNELTKEVIPNIKG
jgi:hypothetical protein